MKLKYESSKKIAVLKNALRKGIPLSALIAAATALSGCASEREPVLMGKIATTPEKPAPKKPNAVNEDTYGIAIDGRIMPVPEKPIKKK